MGELTAGFDLVVDAPAKLNLRLEIVGTRSDGLHLIDTDMVPVAVCDRIRIQRRRDGQVSCAYSGADISAEDDLCMRAATLLKRRSACAGGADIRVKKRIPVGSGMGGGSSDAAAVLNGLNLAWGLEATRAELEGMAVELGADVPFFLHGRPMRATGVGELLEPLPLRAERYFIAVPEWRLSTAAVYGRYDNLIKCPLAGNLAELAGAMGPNDLTAAAADLSPPLFGTIAEYLLGLFGNACLSGSGSAMFSKLPGDFPEAELKGATRSLPPGTGWFAAEGMVARREATGE